MAADELSLWSADYYKSFEVKPNQADASLQKVAIEKFTRIWIMFLSLYLYRGEISPSDALKYIH